MKWDVFYIEYVYVGWMICGSICVLLFLLRLFMQVLLREIILQPNCTVIMEMRGSCLETQTQNDDDDVFVCLCGEDGGGVGGVAAGHADVR